MANLYDKLGQYSGSELPQSPSEVSVFSVNNDSIVLTWTPNSSGYTTSTIVIQTWQGNYWETKTELNYDAVDGSLSSLSEGTLYRIRVAQLLDGVLYASSPLTQTTTSIPKPTLTESGVTSSSIGVNITGYDATWESIKMYNYDDGWQLVDTIAATATTYSYTGLNASEQYFLQAAAVIEGVEYEGDYVAITTAAGALVAITITNAYDVAISGDNPIEITWSNDNDTASLGGSHTVTLMNNCMGEAYSESAGAGDRSKSLGFFTESLDCMESNWFNFGLVTAKVRYTDGSGNYVETEKELSVQLNP